MSSEAWVPDDSFLDEKRERGVNAINAALQKYGFSSGRDRILTSRDPRMDQVRHELRRERMPAGWQSWQLPVYMVERPTFGFLQVAGAGAVLPEHHHDTDQFRIVLSGGMNYNGVELKTGDWMFIPKGRERGTYGVSAALNPGLICFYMY